MVFFKCEMCKRRKKYTSLLCYDDEGGPTKIGFLCLDCQDRVETFIAKGGR